MPPALRVAWGGTDVLLEVVPDRGCDAGDHDSADLLEAVDDTVRHAVEDTVRRIDASPVDRTRRGRSTEESSIP